VLAQQLEEPAARAEAAPEALPEQAVPRVVAARPQVVRAAWDAAAVPQPVAAAGAVGLRPEERAAVWDAVAGLRREEQAVAPAVAGVPQPGARRAAVRVAEVPLRAAPDVPEVLPSGAAWAAHLSTRLPEVRLAPSPRARAARARERLRPAQP
jgi:hypothetical protein